MISSSFLFLRRDGLFCSADHSTDIDDNLHEEKLGLPHFSPMTLSSWMMATGTATGTVTGE